MDVSIVTVNFRSKDHLERMIASVFKYTKGIEFELLVINNDLEELSWSDRGAKSTEQVTIRNNATNIGFAAACNQGIEMARGRYVALLNPDVELTNDSVSKMVERMDQDTNVGIAGPRLVYPDGTAQASVRRFPRLLDQLLVMLKLPHALTNLGIINHYLHTDLDVEKTQDVDQVMGAYFVIRRELINAIGFLDEGFFYWYEEVDYCRRAVRGGWKVRYYADVEACHTGGGSFSREKTIKKQAVIRRSLRRYARKHWGWKAYLVLVLLDPLFRLLAVVAHTLKKH